LLRGRGIDQERLGITLQTSDRPETLTRHSNQPMVSSSGKSGRGTETGSTSSRSFVSRTAVLSSPDASAPLAVVPTAASTGARKDSNGEPGGSPSKKSPITVGSSSPEDKPSLVDSAQAISIPQPIRTPLRSPIPPPRAGELELTLPRSVVQRLEQMERRLEKVEQKITDADGTHRPSHQRLP
jgi:hypothetical protein